MVSAIQEVNIQQAYIFGTGNHQVRDKDPLQDTGYADWQDSIEVRDSSQNVLSPQPTITDQQFIDWENARLAEIAQETADDASIQASLSNTKMDKSKYAIALQLLDGLTGAFLDGQSPTTATVYQGFVTSLGGTMLENPIKNYVTMMTGIIAFGTGIADTDKQSVMLHAQLFLTSGIAVQNAK